MESVRCDINEYLGRPREVFSMFSASLRILDRNTAELMANRMKDEIVDLKEQKDERKEPTNDLEVENNALKTSSDEKDAEIARLRKLLKEQNK